MNVTRTPTASRHPADALLAAFVDGRLGGDEHRRLVAHLSGCEVCREVVAETAKTLRDSELTGCFDDEEGTEEDVEPSSSRPGKVLRPAKSRFRRALPLIATLTAAAAVAALLVLTPAGRGILGLGSEDEVAELTAGLEGEEIRRFLTLGDYDSDWGGGLLGESSPLAELDAETSFQLGARVTQLDVALHLRERDAAKVLAVRVSALVSDPTVSLFYGGGQGLQGRLAEEADSAELLQLNARGDEGLRSGDESASLHWYDLGRWTAAGSLAALAEDPTKLRQPTFQRQGRRLNRRDWPPAVEGPLAAISSLLADGVDEGEWNALRQEFEKLMEAGGNHDGWTEPSDSENEPAV